MYQAYSRRVGSFRRYRRERIAGRLRYWVEETATRAAKGTQREFVVMEGEKVVTRIVPVGGGVRVERT